ncbi:MAG: hypothetical protein JWO55_610 [Candidatus Saccharibacteria bacterium]|jgi:hypothetical protein|nr:hypothetical protein [Candidatus Saccharibacteria bacterium]
MSRTRYQSRSPLNDELRPDKSYKRLKKHMMQKEFGLA